MSRSIIIGYVILALFKISLISEIIFIFLIQLKKLKKDYISHFFLLIIFILVSVEIILRSVKIRFLALTNTFESLMFFSAVICLIIFIYRFLSKEKTLKIAVFLGTVVAFILFAISLSPLASKEVALPMPALKSGWLLLHVSFAFIGEAFFAFSFAISIYYFIIKDHDKKMQAEKLIHTCILIGYPIFTAGALIFGAIWAKFTWSRFWSWDPKEIFALITWLVYTIYLHLRFYKKINKNIIVMIAVIGFLLTVFTFLGVNYLLPSNHSGYK